MAKEIDERGNTVRTEDTNRTVEASAVEARQGNLGRPVLYVLIGGLALALLAWSGAEMFGEAVDDDAATEVTQPATTPSVTPDDQPVVNNTPPAGETQQTAPTDADPTPQTGSGGPSQAVSPSGTNNQ